MYEGGRPRGFCGFIVGREEELELDACGERLLGRGVVLPVPGGVGDGLLEDLRLEPTRFFKRAFMDDIDRREEGRPSTLR